MTGMHLTHVPYKGTAQAINDVVAGHVPLIFSDIAPAVQLIKDGRLRPLGISSATRFANLLDVPPIADAGAHFNAACLLDGGRARRTPKPIVDKLHGALKSIASRPRHAAPARPRQYSADLAAPRRAWDLRQAGDRTLGKVVEQAGIAGSE